MTKRKTRRVEEVYNQECVRCGYKWWARNGVDDRCAGCGSVKYDVPLGTNQQGSRSKYA